MNVHYINVNLSPLISSIRNTLHLVFASYLYMFPSVRPNVLYWSNMQNLVILNVKNIESQGQNFQLKYSDKITKNTEKMNKQKMPTLNHSVFQVKAIRTSKDWKKQQFLEK